MKRVACWMIIGLVAVTGCHKHCYRPAPVAVPCPNCPPPSGGFIPGPAAPMQPVPRAGQLVVPQGVPSQPPAGLPRTGPAVSEYRAPTQAQKPLPPSGVQPATARLLPVDPGTGVDTAGGTKPVEVPTEIPRFALVDGRSAAGLVPFPEGYAWLKSQGFRTVLLIHAPGEDLGSVADDAKKADLPLKTLEVRPGQASPEQVAAFAKIVQSEGPVFVCDKTGELAGELWLGYFRDVERLPEVTAKARARRLGWKE